MHEAFFRRPVHQDFIVTDGIVLPYRQSLPCSNLFLKDGIQLHRQGVCREMLRTCLKKQIQVLAPTLSGSRGQTVNQIETEVVETGLPSPTDALSSMC